MVGRGKNALANLLRDRRILISDKAEKNILDMPRAKRRSLWTPLVKIVGARVDSLGRLLRPCFTFGAVQPEFVVIGGVIRREASLLIGYAGDAVQIFSAVDNDQLIKRHESDSKAGCWHVKEEFSIRGRLNAMYVCTIKKVMFFIARFGQLERQKTRCVYSFDKNKYLTEQEVKIFMRTHNIPMEPDERS